MDFVDPEKAWELIRVWAGDGKQHFVTKGSVWEDPAAWGILLVDIAKNVARSYVDAGWNERDALDRIVQGLRAELNHNTDAR